MKIRATLIALIIGSAMLLQACGPTTLRSFATDLNKASKILNSAAQTNHILWQNGTISIATRRKVATIIHSANDDLIAEIDFAKTLTDASFATSKAKIQTDLLAITKSLAVPTGNAQLDTLLQSAAAIINTAIGLLARMEKRDVLPYMDEVRAFRLEAIA